MRKLLKLVNWDFAAGWFFCSLFYAFVGGGIVPAHATPIGDLPADANSYFAYIHDHSTFTGLGSQSRLLFIGQRACDQIRSGLPPSQVGSTGLIADIPGIVDAAQHELCPDTLR